MRTRRRELHRLLIEGCVERDAFYKKLKKVEDLSNDLRSGGLDVVVHANTIGINLQRILGTYKYEPTPPGISDGYPLASAVDASPVAVAANDRADRWKKRYDDAMAEVDRLKALVFEHSLPKEDIPGPRRPDGWEPGMD